MSNVNKRTIQRAEKSEPIALETAAFIAEALGVPPLSIRSIQMELFETSKKEANEVILVPVTSGRRIIDTLRNSFETELTFDVEPSQENVKPLAVLASLLELFKTDQWANPYDKYDPNYSEILEKQAEVNMILPILSDQGVTVFLATYTAISQIPSYDRDEGHMYVTDRSPFKEVQNTLIVVSDSTSSHLVQKPKDLYIEGDIPF